MCASERASERERKTTRRMDGRTDGRTNGWIHGWLDGRTHPLGLTEHRRSTTRTQQHPLTEGHTYVRHADIVHNSVVGDDVMFVWVLLRACMRALVGVVIIISFNWSVYVRPSVRTYGRADGRNVRLYVCTQVRTCTVVCTTTGKQAFLCVWYFRISLSLWGY